MHHQLFGEMATESRGGSAEEWRGILRWLRLGRRSVAVTLGSEYQD